MLYKVLAEDPVYGALRKGEPFRDISDEICRTADVNIDETVHFSISASDV